MNGQLAIGARDDLIRGAAARAPEPRRRINHASWQKPAGAGVLVGDDETQSEDLT
jgi:hypothetical protein